MNENDLGKALLRGEDPIDIEALTARVLRRDRRRIWFLGIACVVAWMAVVMLPWSTILPMMAKMGQYQARVSGGPPLTAAEQQAHEVELARVFKEGTIATFICSVASMFVAAICTVLLIVISRRATLRQVNARLAQISEQIKLLGKERREA